MGDVIKTGPDTTLAADFFVGARVGVKRDSAVKLVSEDDAMVLGDHGWRQIMVRHGGVWEKFKKHEQPITVQSRGGIRG